MRASPEIQLQQEVAARRQAHPTRRVAAPNTAHTHAQRDSRVPSARPARNHRVATQTRADADDARACKGSAVAVLEHAS